MYQENNWVQITNVGEGVESSQTTSNNVRSLPPVIFHTIPVALSIPISSKGDWMAFNAASLALVLPAS